MMIASAPGGSSWKKSPLSTRTLPLTPVRQKSGKLVYAFAVEQDFDPTRLASNTFELEWPPRSGRVAPYPELDRAAWFTPEAARTKVLAGQLPLIDELLALVAGGLTPPR